MSTKIYKYFPHTVHSLIFERKNCCGLKCSLPKEYNDPYELFLGVDVSLSPDLLATYKEIIEEVPQYPTTCFSKSPIVTPMWAHYANNHSGFVLEFDVAAIECELPDVALREVSYKDEADEDISQFLARAAVTKKPRHAIWLQQKVLSEAYFSKTTVWGYEQEYRLVDQNRYVEQLGDVTVLFVPMSCVSAIAVGRNSPDELDGDTKAIARTYGINWYKAAIGRSTSSMFFRSENDGLTVF